MTKKSLIRIALVSACILIIPLFGNMYIDGWNWAFSDFVFAFVFFCITGLGLQFAKIKLATNSSRMIVYTIILLVMISIWAVLATG